MMLIRRPIYCLISEPVILDDWGARAGSSSMIHFFHTFFLFFRAFNLRNILRVNMRNFLVLWDFLSQHLHFEYNKVLRKNPTELREILSQKPKCKTFFSSISLITSPMDDLSLLPFYRYIHVCCCSPLFRPLYLYH